MHTDLSSHLHTDRCNELIGLLKKCHEENPFTKLFGACNHEDKVMIKCLKEERLERRRKNHENSLKMKATLRERLVEAKEEKTF